MNDALQPLDLHRAAALKTAWWDRPVAETDRFRNAP
jgi:hypothetical protein